MKDAAPDMRSRRWTVGAGAAGIVALLAWLAFDRDPPRPPPPPAEVVVVAAPASTVAPTAAAASPPPATLLAPPTAPVIAGAIPAAPDAFVGRWRGGDAATLTIARTAADRYAVHLASGDADERFDGVLRDGRIHVERGIDGDWVQATTDANPCLYFGTGARFCRSG